jgi:archaellum component FlaC
MSHLTIFIYNDGTPGYKHWAAVSRNWVVQRKNSRSADQANAIDAASKAAFETLNRRIDRMDDRLERVENGINSILILLQE